LHHVLYSFQFFILLLDKEKAPVSVVSRTTKPALKTLAIFSIKKAPFSETSQFQKGRYAEYLIRNKEKCEFESCNSVQNGRMHLCKKLRFAEREKPGKA